MVRILLLRKFAPCGHMMVYLLFLLHWFFEGDIVSMVSHRGKL
jgi:hypothetical protein